MKQSDFNYIDIKTILWIMQEYNQEEFNELWNKLSDQINKIEKFKIKLN